MCKSAKPVVRSSLIYEHMWPQTCQKHSPREGGDSSISLSLPRIRHSPGTAPGKISRPGWRDRNAFFNTLFRAYDPILWVSTAKRPPNRLLTPSGRDRYTAGVDPRGAESVLMRVFVCFSERPMRAAAVNRLKTAARTNIGKSSDNNAIESARGSLAVAVFPVN